MEIAREGENALLAKPGDYETVFKNIEMLIVNELLKKKLGDQGRKIAVSEFSLEAEYSNWHKYLKEVSLHMTSGTVSGDSNDTI